MAKEKMEVRKGIGALPSRKLQEENQGIRRGDGLREQVAKVQNVISNVVERFRVNPDKSTSAKMDTVTSVPRVAKMETAAEFDARMARADSILSGKKVAPADSIQSKKR